MLERLHRMISDLFANPPTWKNTTRKCKGRYVETLCKPHRIQVLTNKYHKSAQLLSREYRVHLFLIQLCEYVAQLGEGPGEVEVKPPHTASTHLNSNFPGKETQFFKSV